MKQIQLIGNLTADCRLVNTETPFLSFDIAVNEKRNGQDTTMYMKVVSNKVNLQQWLTRGKKVFLQGNFKLQEWADEKTGKGGVNLIVSAYTVELLGGANSQQENTTAATTAQYVTSPTPEQKLPDDDLPF